MQEGQTRKGNKGKETKEDTDQSEEPLWKQLAPKTVVFSCFLFSYF